MIINLGPPPCSLETVSITAGSILTDYRYDLTIIAGRTIPITFSLTYSLSNCEPTVILLNSDGTPTNLIFTFVKTSLAYPLVVYTLTLSGVTNVHIGTYNLKVVATVPTSTIASATYPGTLSGGILTIPFNVVISDKCSSPTLSPSALDSTDPIYFDFSPLTYSFGSTQQTILFHDWICTIDDPYNIGMTLDALTTCTYSYTYDVTYY